MYDWPGNVDLREFGFVFFPFANVFLVGTLFFINQVLSGYTLVFVLIFEICFLLDDFLLSCLDFCLGACLDVRENLLSRAFAFFA